MLRARHDPGAQGETLNVAADGQHVAVVLDGEGLEPALIHMPRAGRPPSRVPALSVRQRQPIGWTVALP